MVNCLSNFSINNSTFNMEIIHCSFCKKQITGTKYLYHIRRAHTSLFSTQEEMAKLAYNEMYGVSVVNSIISMYLDGKSLPKIKEKTGMAFKNSRNILTANSINLRSTKETANNPSVRQQYTNTCIEKYGVCNISQVEHIKEKKKQTFLEHYGVDNIWKTKEYYVWLHQHMINKYGATSVSNINNNANYFGYKTMTEDAKTRRKKAAFIGYKKWWHGLSENEKEYIRVAKAKTLLTNHYGSKLETKIKNILDIFNISYVSQFWINRKSYDIRINNTKVIIEVQGDYWHANPSLYNEDDRLKHGAMTYAAKELWEKDAEKLKLANKYNYEVMYLWENDINVMSDSEIMTTIANFIEGSNFKK